MFPFGSPAANHVGLITTRREWSNLHVLLPFPHAPATVPAPLHVPLPAPLSSPTPLPAPLCFIHAKQPETIQAATAAPQLDNATPHQLLPHTSPFPCPLCGRLNDASPVSALHEAEAPILLPPGQPLPTGF